VRFYSARDDDEEGKRERHSLALYIDAQDKDEDHLAEELWLCPYDHIPYYPFSYQSSHSTKAEIIDIDASAFQIPEECYSSLLPTHDSQEEHEETLHNIVYAKRRRLRVTKRNHYASSFKKERDENQPLHCLFTSGSRGVAGVLTNGTLLSLLDMEEDEDMEEEEEEEVDTESDSDDDGEDV